MQAAAPCDFLNGTSLITFCIVIGWKQEAGTSCLSKATTPQMKTANVCVSLSSPSERSSRANSPEASEPVMKRVCAVRQDGICPPYHLTAVENRRAALGDFQDSAPACFLDFFLD